MAGGTAPGSRQGSAAEQLGHGQLDPPRRRAGLGLDGRPRLGGRAEVDGQAGLGGGPGSIGRPGWVGGPGSGAGLDAAA